MLGCLQPQTAHALEPLTFRYRHFLFKIDPDAHPAWHQNAEAWFYREQPIAPIPALRVDGDDVPGLPDGVTRAAAPAWDPVAIRATIEREISPSLARDPGAVTIKRAASGAITFDGVGLPGRQVDGAIAASLAVEALENGVTEVELPIMETQPRITVEDPSLAAQGIQEVVTVGESDFSNSPANRRHNIAAGLSKFNGHLIARGATFSFDTVLGRVDGTTGYLKELVIKGARTEPDYGGGLCQVSTTAYRGAWEYGFPIVARQNHSYAVGHYGPQGTDATVYPPNPDMRFVNDSPGALVMQTYAKDDKAYFIYYGTRDARQSDVFGPFIWDRTTPPPDRTELTTDLPPGVKKKLGERIPGMKAAWFRTLVSATGAVKVEPVFSDYQARPLFYQVGVAALPGTDGLLPDGTSPPPTDIDTAEPPRTF